MNEIYKTQQESTFFVAQPAKTSSTIQLARHEGVYFNGPMAVLFAGSGLFMFYCGCGLAFCLFYGCRKNSEIQIGEEDDDKNVIDLTPNSTAKPTKKGKGKGQDEENLDFYGRGAFDRGQGSQVALNGKKNIFDQSRSSTISEKKFAKVRDGDASQFDAFAKASNPQDQKTRNAPFDASGQWKFALEDGASTQARTPGKAKMLKAQAETDEQVEEDDVLPFDRQEPNTANKLMISGGTPNLIGEDFKVLSRK